MLDSIYHMTLKILKSCILGVECQDFQLRELGLEYGVWGMEFNSKFGFKKQRWY